MFVKLVSLTVLRFGNRSLIFIGYGHIRKPIITVISPLLRHLFSQASCPPLLSLVVMGRVPLLPNVLLRFIEDSPLLFLVLRLELWSRRRRFRYLIVSFLF